MPEITVEIINEKGMHARTASQFVQLVQQSPDDTITVIKDDKEISGTSILGLLTLSATKGSFLTIKATGKTAEKTLADLEKLIESGFL